VFTGFGLRVRAGGTKSYIRQYRNAAGSPSACAAGWPSYLPLGKLTLPEG
jgi:hypothetical protein